MDERLHRSQLRSIAIPGTRALVLLSVCLGTLMVVLDGSIVYVALPTIGSALGLTTNSLVWVVNGYAISCGALLLLSGRLGDWYGHHRLFLLGTALFTLASLACGLAETPALLIGGRAAQGAASAVVLTVSISCIMEDFPEPSQRARAMAVYSCVQAAGGSMGLLIGGVVTYALNWRWLFLINLPIGAIIGLLHGLMREESRERTRVSLDLAGAVTITASLLLTISAALSLADAGWLSVYTWGPLGAALSLLALFVVIEARTQSPLVPLTLLRERNLRVTLGAGALWAGGIYIWSVMAAFYMQRVLGYNALQLALAFLPAALIAVASSLALSARLIHRFGSKALLGTGIALQGLAMLLLARAPVRAVYSLDILPCMLLNGLGGGLAGSPYVLSGLSRVRKDDYGIASAILNSAISLGGSVALAVVAGIAAVRNGHHVAGAINLPLSQPGSYSVALCAAALLAAGAAFVSRYINE
jgi:EmrB/QacA subfamily drug resistance transporter